MYIFELISTIINKIKNPEKKIEKDFSDEYQNCEHTFVPVDSTKKVLACIKCGLVKKSKRFKQRIIILKSQKLLLH